MRARKETGVDDKGHSGITLEYLWKVILRGYLLAAIEGTCTHRGMQLVSPMKEQRQPHSPGLYLVGSCSTAFLVQRVSSINCAQRGYTVCGRPTFAAYHLSPSRTRLHEPLEQVLPVPRALKRNRDRPAIHGHEADEAFLRARRP